ncbi:MAG TPA: anthranilate phosphoribosyltransferase [Rhizomicrobium sp.]|jgi:anthranilate phosphoribosyltransferase
MSGDAEFVRILKRLVEGETLDTETADAAFTAIVAGEVSEARAASLLTALALRSPTVEEIAGAASAMRGAMRSISAPEGAIDLCGTGGDGQGTLNISTAASFVVAACGVPVAKHGNRNMSSRTGAADVLEALGIRIDLTPTAAAACLAETGLCFLFAPTYHPAMKHVAPVRKELGFRTVFNLLGPICNPGRVKRQLLGVFSESWIEPLAHVLAKLGTERAWVVHGGDGTDELTTTTRSFVAELDHGQVRRFEITPQDAGLASARLDDIRGGDAPFNAQALQCLLAGDGLPAYRDMVILNAAGALIVAGRAADLRAAAEMARGALDNGHANDMCERMRAATARLAP